MNQKTQVRSSSVAIMSRLSVARAPPAAVVASDLCETRPQAQTAPVCRLSDKLTSIGVCWWPVGRRPSHARWPLGLTLLAHGHHATK
jgi:hypothetical protein